MATVILQYAGAALGGFIGGPIGAVIGRAAGAIAGSLIDQALFAPKARRVEGPRLKDLQVMTSQEGAPIPRVWGRMRLAGQLIWATEFEEVISTRTEGGSSKGSGGGAKTKVTEYAYFGNMALALCEGEISGIGRVWADGKPLDLSNFTTRLYLGTETQAPDSLIVAKEGAANAPAYRGTAYIVFERMPLADYGNRLPQLSFEVIRRVDGAAERVRAVNIIPGASEFAYQTGIVTRDGGGGLTTPENAHASTVESDWTRSLDDLQRTCPNLGAASLVVAWFGNDLRCGSCLVRPAVETAAKATLPVSWKVAGLTRGVATVVSQSGGAAAFGGTPSDAAVVSAIQDLRARGLEITFYPFLLMDIPPGNTLPDPLTGFPGQPAYPWRGRITGVGDKSAAATAQVASFVGTALPAHFAVSGGEVAYSGPTEWTLRRMVLHYAKLCEIAGGVDSFLIASEMRGLTTLRDSAVSYPFVAALVQLAADVKAMLPGAKVSYAADWSEYFGHHPQDGTGDVFFHLDALWASANVGCIGIDNYMPLSDWRDGAAHADLAAGTRAIFDLDYLKSNIAGGEGYDWHYADAAARTAQTRTPITDGAYGKPWVFRYKDLKSWWLNQHFDRPGGVQSATPTGWTPQSKPIRFTEAGCPAVDKGANQPNVFVDPKSSESFLPYFSNGFRDDAMPHAYVKALTDFWMAAGPHNPVSSVYGAEMLDAARTHIWAWDARPFPAFPALSQVWADGGNYALGHWLNGRIGAVTVGDLASAILDDYGSPGILAERVEGMVEGYAADRMSSARDLIEPLTRAFAFDALESGGTIALRGRRYALGVTLPADALAEADAGEPLYRLTHAQETELPVALNLAYAETASDFRVAAVAARRLTGSSARETAFELAAAMPQHLAQARADVMLQELWVGRDRAEFILPPHHLALEPGDLVTLATAARAHVLRIDEIADGAARKVLAHAYEASVYDPPPAPARGIAYAGPAVTGPPAYEMMDLPLADFGLAAHAPWIAAVAAPWPGRVNLLEKRGASFVLNRALDAPATMGELATALAAGPVDRFDRANRAEVSLYGGALASVSEMELLGGANAAAVGGGGVFEILQFRDAVLTGPGRYEISWLLRGQNGSAPEMAASWPSGSRFVLLTPAVAQADLGLDAVGRDIVWRIGPAGRDHGDPAYLEFPHRPSGLGLRPRAPAHARVRRDAGDALFSWIRQTRIGGDAWDLPDVPLGEEQEAYRLEIFDGAGVVRTVSVAAPTYRYPAALELADFGGTQTNFHIRLAQMSLAYGAGSALETTIDV